MILVVGSTGFLGTNICQRLRTANHAVRALVRPTTKIDRVDVLRAMGAELVSGDLKDPSSLRSAVRGARIVITTATATGSRAEGDSIETVDLRGQLQLLDAAKREGVKHFIYVSFFPQPIEFPLQSAKRAVEHAIMAKDLPYTIFQPTDFMEVWLGPPVGFDPRGTSVRIFGDGTKATSWISAYDVAAFVAAAIDNARAVNEVFPLGGAPMSYLDVLAIFKRLGASADQIENVSENQLETQFREASDPLARSIAALTLTTARGLIASSAKACAAIPLTLKTVEGYAAQLIRDPKPHG